MICVWKHCLLFSLFSSCLALLLHTDPAAKRCSFSKIALGTCSTASETIPEKITSYEYMDSGNGMRLERFGDILVTRSCPSAIWSRGLSNAEWDAATVRYCGNHWHGLETIPVDDADAWVLHMENHVKFILATSEQGQLGVFPEQQVSWAWLQKTLRSFTTNSKKSEVSVLNGFAYTGGSTMACLGVPGVHVVHLDAAKASVNWAARNVNQFIITGKYDPSSLDVAQVDIQRSLITRTQTTANACNGVGVGAAHKVNVSSSPRTRFIVEDCMTYLRREERRGAKYEGLIFDPPAFGRGGGRKVWKLSKDLPALVEMIPRLLASRPAFVLLTCHDPACPAKKLASLLQESGILDVGVGARLQCGDLTLNSKRGGQPLPLGSYARVLWEN